MILFLKGIGCNIEGPGKDERTSQTEKSCFMGESRGEGDSEGKWSVRFKWPQRKDDTRGGMKSEGWKDECKNMAKDFLRKTCYKNIK